MFFSFSPFDRGKIRAKIKTDDRIETLRLQFLPSPPNFSIKLLFVSFPSLRGRPARSLLRPRRPLSLLLTSFLPPFPSLRLLHFLFPFSSSFDPSALTATLSCCPHLLPSLRTHPMLSRAAPLGGAIASPGLAPLRLAPASPHPSLPCLHALPPLSSPVPSQLLPTFLFLRRLSVPITPSTSLLLTSHVESTLLPKLYFLLPPRWAPYIRSHNSLTRTSSIFSAASPTSAPTTFPTTSSPRLAEEGLEEEVELGEESGLDVGGDERAAARAEGSKKEKDEKKERRKQKGRKGWVKRRGRGRCRKRRRDQGRSLRGSRR